MRWTRRLTAALAGAAMVVAGLTAGLAPAAPARAEEGIAPVVFILDASGSMVRETSPG
ncbi:MAG: hypothetical protein QM626_01085 [Microbacterium sp.]|uniref:hypothetical protein n=1 Tax=Microbacterium sp. TaxID=51671 RepID=UPI0039E40578